MKLNTLLIELVLFLKIESGIINPYHPSILQRRGPSIMTSVVGNGEKPPGSTEGNSGNSGGNNNGGNNSGNNGNKKKKKKHKKKKSYPTMKPDEKCKDGNCGDNSEPNSGTSGGNNNSGSNNN